MERERLGAHPVVRAWRTIRPGSPDPETVEILATKKKAPSVYRLVGVGPGGAPVVAKQVTSADEAEVVTFARILPLLDVPTLECYGFVELDEGAGWLFVEDAGECRYSRWSSVHRQLAGRWLVELHAAVAETPEAESLLTLLPDRSSGHYGAQLGQARRDLAVWRSFDERAEAARERILPALDAVERIWPEIEEMSSLLPKTLVHGDFRTKNMRIRREVDGTLAFLVFDWESTGFGSPLVDLDPAVSDSHLHAVVDWDATELQPAMLGVFAEILNTIAAVHWLIDGGEEDWWEDFLTVDIYSQILEAALDRRERLLAQNPGRFDRAARIS